ncbi:MAG: site-specific integrase [Sulfuricurvum sp.]|nr:site-specific integrase [Sulfuricurvum sp.]MDP3023018.1 site-specific integrase [Sulfuricurvum sp.]
MKYFGITTKIVKGNVPNIIVRFKHLNVSYNNKNFTKLYGCDTEKKAFDKLQEIKRAITDGNNPFIKHIEPEVIEHKLNDLWDERLERMIENKTWNFTTARGYKYFYDAHIRGIIGDKDISTINYADLLLVEKKLNHTDGSSNNKFKRMMNSLFDECVNLKYIEENIILKLKTQKEGKPKELEKVSNEDFLTIVRKMYHHIPNFVIENNAGIKSEFEVREYQMFLYMVLLTAHRYGEILQLRKEHCYLDQNKIIAPESITKTKEDYHFPIPIECREWIENIKEGLLFPSINKSAIWHVFHRYVRDSGIHVYQDKTISIHDTRKLMLSIMVNDCDIDSTIADSCLNHKQKGTMKHYLNKQYKNVVKSYNKYWNIIKEVEDVKEEIIVVEDLPESLQETIRNLIKMENMKNQGILK